MLVDEVACNIYQILPGSVSNTTAGSARQWAIAKTCSL